MNSDNVFGPATHADIQFDGHFPASFRDPPHPLFTPRGPVDRRLDIQSLHGWGRVLQRLKNAGLPSRIQTGRPEHATCCNVGGGIGDLTDVPSTTGGSLESNFNWERWKWNIGINVSSRQVENESWRSRPYGPILRLMLLVTARSNLANFSPCPSTAVPCREIHGSSTDNNRPGVWEVAGYRFGEFYRRYGPSKLPEAPSQRCWRHLSAGYAITCSRRNRQSIYRLRHLANLRSLYIV